MSPFSQPQFLGAFFVSAAHGCRFTAPTGDWAFKPRFFASFAPRHVPEQLFVKVPLWGIVALLSNYLPKATFTHPRAGCSPLVAPAEAVAGAAAVAGATMVREGKHEARPTWWAYFAHLDGRG